MVSIWFLLTETTTSGAYDPPKQGGYTNKQTNKTCELQNVWRGKK
jgi:hypothetical protein